MKESLDGTIPYSSLPDDHTQTPIMARRRPRVTPPARSILLGVTRTDAGRQDERQRQRQKR